MNREFDGQVEYYIPEVKDYFELALEERIKQIHQQLITEMEDYKKVSLIAVMDKQIKEKNRKIWKPFKRLFHMDNITRMVTIYMDLVEEPSQQKITYKCKRANSKTMKSTHF